MKKKVLLSIFLLLLSFMLLNYASESYAYSDATLQLKEYVEQTANYFSNNSYYQYLKIHFERESFLNIVEELDPSYYDTWIIRSNGENYIGIGLLNTTEESALTVDGGYNITNIDNMIVNYYYYKKVNNVWQYILNSTSTTSLANVRTGNAFTSSAKGSVMIYTDLIPTINTTSTAGNVIFIGKQAYGYIQALASTLDLNNSTTDNCYIADMRLGTNYINNYSINMYYLSNGVPVYYDAEIEVLLASSGYDGNNYQIQINRQNIVNNATYYLDLIVNDTIVSTTEVTLLYSGNEVSESTTGQITNQSGEITGSIDLSNIENGIGSINENISNLPNQIEEILYNSGESGESGETKKGIFQKVYEDLFTIDQEEVEEKFTNTIQELQDMLPSGESGESEIAKIGLDILDNNQPGDFIISWPSTETHFTIGGEALAEQVSFNSNNDVLGGINQINFSKLERENEHFQTVMHYARAILTFAIIVMISKNLWNTFLLTIGISPQIYEKATEEQRVAEQNEKKWQNKLETQRYNDWLRSHRK